MSSSTLAGATHTFIKLLHSPPSTVENGGFKRRKEHFHSTSCHPPSLSYSTPLLGSSVDNGGFKWRSSVLYPVSSTPSLSAATQLPSQP